MEQVTAFKASDDSLWTTEEAANEHEEGLRWRDRIEEYRKSDLCPYPLSAHGRMATKVIISWELFKAKAKGI